MSVEILTGDCREVLKTLPEKSIHCCVTSPPYWGLRDYGVDGQLGLEPTPEEYVENMVEVFKGVHRVLRDDGTLWLNIGDSYAGSRCGGNSNSITGKGRNESVSAKVKLRKSFRRDKEPMPNFYGQANECKPKDLVGIPWMLAFALRADGWYLRQDIIWNKPNPMPESVNDRCTKAHEYIFLLSKSSKYYYNQDSILEPCSPTTHARLSQDVQNQIGSDRGNGGRKTNGPMKAVGRKFDSKSGNKNNPSFDSAMAIMPEKRNKRSVWKIATQPYKGAHFATFPKKLIEPCVLAGCPEGGVVIDPFGGSGTTGEVAIENKRNAILIELNPEYIPLQEKRTSMVQRKLL